MMNDERVRRERDLFLRLLELGRRQEVQPVLREALDLAIAATRAVRGYVELYGPNGEQPEWSMAQGCSEADVAAIQARTCRGIVQESLATGTTLNIPSALLDDRFNHRESVRGRPDDPAVLCTPLGTDEVLGVLYLEGRPGAEPFSSDDVSLAETIARHIGPLATRIHLERQSYADTDATRLWRDKLELRGLVGRSQALAKVIESLALVAPHEVTVLLTGPSGTGKTSLAHAIHKNSPRRNRPFIEVSCANIPASLLESELFGTEPGAHSTAHERRAGRVAMAEGGTLFLDEVAELSGTSQSGLLQLLQSKTYTPLGGKRPETADIRIIAATNADLPERVRTRQFREDLFYRLNVIPVHLPPLAERPEDIIPLAEHFAEEFIRRSPGRRGIPFSPLARLALMHEAWPGNVRQLENVVEAGLIRALGHGADAIEKHHLFPGTRAAEPESLSFQEQTRRFQKRLLEQVLTDCDWNVRQASERLGLVRQHVHNLIKVHGLQRT